MNPFLFRRVDEHPSRHSIKPLTNKLACQDTSLSSTRALIPISSKSVLSFTRHGPSVLAGRLSETPIAPSPLASTKYDLEAPLSGAPEGSHSSPPKRSKRHGAELSENAAGLLIGVEDRVRTSMLEQLQELASPRSQPALARALQPLPITKGSIQYSSNERGDRAADESEVDGEVARVQGRHVQGGGSSERCRSVPPSRAESSTLWQRTLWPVLSPESRTQIAEFKALLAKTFRAAGQSERGETGGAQPMWAADSGTECSEVFEAATSGSSGPNNITKCCGLLPYTSSFGWAFTDWTPIRETGAVF